MHVLMHGISGEGFRIVSDNDAPCVQIFWALFNKLRQCNCCLNLSKSNSHKDFKMTIELMRWDDPSAAILASTRANKSSAVCFGGLKFITLSEGAAAIRFRIFIGKSPPPHLIVLLLDRRSQMSRMTNLFADLVRCAALASKGAGGTKNNRIKHLRKFAEWAWNNNVQLQCTASVRFNHFKLFVSHLISEGKSVRTVNNYLAALRMALRGAGKGQLAEEASNKVLGVGSGSRKGKKRAITIEEYDAACSKVADEDVGVLACLMLELYFGLRAEEAIQAYKSLKTWLAHLINGIGITVIFGTKNGRPRYVEPTDREAALGAIAVAMQVCAERRGKLIAKPNLKKALRRYNYITGKVGLTGEISGHSLRYAFAQRLKAKYDAEGFNPREALALVAMALGHGGGRGRFVKSVYFISKEHRDTLGHGKNCYS